jgi:hypothetical protein
MKRQFYYGIFEQERESISETWESAYDPEPYDFYPTLKDARKIKKQLTAVKNPLIRFFIKKEFPVDIILGRF